MSFCTFSIRKTIAPIITAFSLASNTSCNEAPVPFKVDDTDRSVTITDLGAPPIVDVQVAFDDSVYSADEEIGMAIKLVNISDSTQSVLFDRPTLSTGGPWSTSAEVKPLDVTNSQLRYLSKIVMHSNSYAEKDLTDSTYAIQPGKFITGYYNLSDLITFNTPGNKLNPGHYEIQVFYAGNGSNKVIIRIEAGGQ